MSKRVASTVSSSTAAHGSPTRRRPRLTLRFANLYIRFSELVPPVLSISINRFSYGDKPTTSLTKSRTIFVRFEIVPFLFEGRTARVRFSTGYPFFKPTAIPEDDISLNTKTSRPTTCWK